MKLRHATALLVLSALAATAAAALAPSAESARPLAVGTKVPAAALRTMQGEPADLARLLDGKPTVLIFYRGGWCPFCNKHLAALAEIEPKIAHAGYQIIALSPDNPEALRATSEKRQLSYRLVSDRDMQAALAFGVAFRVDPALVAKYRDYKIELPLVPGDDETRWLPMPSVFVVDATGVIRFVHSNPDYRVRLSADELLAALPASAQ